MRNTQTMDQECIREANSFLASLLKGESWKPARFERLLSAECSDALFSILVEGLSDRFETRLSQIYADLFAKAISQALPEHSEAALRKRYGRVTQSRRYEAPVSPRQAFVLSRVTLGADVAITSIILDGLKKRFPETEIFLVGGRKNWELFEGDARVKHQPLAYRRRGSLLERLAPALELRGILPRRGAIVVDPDSRFTQLGLMPVCAEQDYYLFPSRSYGAGGDDALPILTRRWMQETFAASDCAAYIRPRSQDVEPIEITVSLGTGENHAKRLDDAFEARLLGAIAERASSVCVDAGAGGDESARVFRAVSQIGTDNVRVWRGSFAGFASRIAKSCAYVGYDSAGQHVAAACGIPLVTIFRGFASSRMLARWTPAGPARCTVLRVEPEETSETVWARTEPALRSLLSGDG